MYYASFNNEHILDLLSMSSKLKGDLGQGLGSSNYITKLFSELVVIKFKSYKIILRGRFSTLRIFVLTFRAER